MIRRTACRMLLLLLVLLLPLFVGCARRADMDDIRTLQSEIDELRLQNYELEQRVAALEAGPVEAPAATPEPSSSAPDATPVPVQTYSMTADEICSQLLKDGMPVASFYRRTEKDDPDQLLGTKNGYTSRADFRDLGIPMDLGVIEVFGSETLAALRENVLSNEIKSGQRDKETLFRYDNVLLRLPAAFSSEQAMRYEEALRKVLGIVG